MSVADEIRTRVEADAVGVYSAVLGGADFQQKGGELCTKCPLHDDSRPSFQLNPAKGQWYCHPCGKGGDVFELYALRHGLNCKQDFVKVSADLGRLLGINGSTGRVVATYSYFDEKGTILFQKLRKEPKDFKLRRPDGSGGWIPSIEGVRRVLYRLPELVAANPSTWVWIVEGEKDADRMATREFVATTSPFGGSKTPSKKKWCPEFTECFRNRKVAIVPDNDTTGREFSDYIAAELLPVATEVRLVRLPPDCKDAADFFEKGHTREELVELLERAPKETDLGQQFRRDDAKAKANKSRTTTNTPKLFAFALELEAELVSLSPSLPTDDLAKRLRELAVRIPKLSPLDRAMWREGVVKKLNELGFSSPAKIAAALLPAPAREAKGGAAGTAFDFETLEPSANAVAVSDLLDELSTLFGRFFILPEHGRTVLALWVLLTHAYDSFDICPMLAVVSPTKRCGKTHVLEMLSILSHRPVVSSNISPSSIFRTIDRWHPTLIVDEYETIKENEELRGILNSGHSHRLAFVIRTSGDEHDPRRFSTWGPKALALIGTPPDTIEDRSFLLRMRRKTRSEKVERWRPNRLFVELRELRERMLRFWKDSAGELRQADPEIPTGLNDRAADNWGPMLAIADLAGGSWPKEARKAAASFSGEPDSESDSILLLEDFRRFFGELGELGEKIASATIVERLLKLEDRPWPEYGKGGKPISASGVAKLLRPFGIKPKTVKLKDQSTAKGYHRDDFKDAFERYLDPDTPSSPQEGASEPSPRHQPHGTRASSDFRPVTPDSEVTGEKSRKPLGDKDGDGVTARKGDPGPEGGSTDLGDDYEEGEL